jgi:hypothetical protein
MRDSFQIQGLAPNFAHLAIAIERFAPSLKGGLKFASLGRDFGQSLDRGESLRSISNLLSCLKGTPHACFRV